MRENSFCLSTNIFLLSVRLSLIFPFTVACQQMVMKAHQCEDMLAFILLDLVVKFLLTQTTGSSPAQIKSALAY